MTKQLYDYWSSYLESCGTSLDREIDEARADMAEEKKALNECFDPVEERERWENIQTIELYLSVLLDAASSNF